ncbi:oxidoreductase [Rhodococcus sp. 14C212]|uniref:PDR/VanB family oxidoreductase n=1 Tax=Rhodococcus sp. 14C212 TaxID=2711209 RepID=UPI0013EE1B49|nr:PDR/VanB family oxidoreductase [Rhodococcus sp. 14C212]NGP08696.1 oxidoreductase [Rhodococcus sp. 14C212]
MDLELRVLQRRSVADGIVELTLAHPDGCALPPWDAGAHIDLELGELLRQYSLTGLETRDDRWIVSILREQAGRGGSRYAHECLPDGSPVRVSLPRNHFRLDAQAPRVLFVAGGIGITPILPMIRQLEAAGTPWELFYCGRSRTSMAYLDELAKFGDRVRIRPDDEFGIPDLGTLVSETAIDTVVYSCGPESLLATLETRCAEATPPRQLRVERFVPKIVEPTEPDHGFDVEFAQSGLTVTVPVGRSILEVAEECGVDIISSCSEGTCGTCETPVLEGIPDHRDSVLTQEEQASCATMMPCVSRAKSARLVLDV